MNLRFRHIWLRKSPSGFTLIELSIGLTLWAIVTLGLTRVFQSALKTWKRTEELFYLQQEARVVLDQMAREFRNQIDVPGIAWSDDGQRITFATVEEHRDKTGTARAAIEKVTYCVMPPSSLHCLKQELSPSGEETFVETVMSPRAASIRWDYAFLSPEGKLRWQSEWKPQAKTTRPCGIRAHLTLWDDSGNPQLYTRTMFDPTARPMPWAT